MTYPERELLIKLVLTTMPTYFLSFFKMSKWGLKKLIDSGRISYGRGKTMKMLKEGTALLIGKDVLDPRG
jgi:hypothetical protein